MKSFFGALFVALAITMTRVTAAPASTSISAPFVNKTDDSREPCVVSSIALNSMSDSFTLRAFTDESPFPWFVALSPNNPSQNGDRPFITQTRQAESVFRLTDGKLSSGGDDLAFFGPTPPAWPPYLDELLFDDEDYTLEFYAAESCDAEGNTYLELRTYEPLAVRTVKEGEQVVGKPPATEEPAVDIRLEVKRVDNPKRQ